MGVSKYDLGPEFVPHPGSSHELMLELVGSNKDVLDVGCDTGYLGKVLIAHGCTVSGVEMNPEAAEQASKHLQRVLVSDLEFMDLESEFGRDSFDVVVFGDVLEHLRDPLSVLRDARSLLRPGGYVVISVPNIAHGDVRLALLSGHFNYGGVGLLDDTHLRFFTRENLIEFLGDAGFVLSELRRSKAPLFGTEIGIEESDFDPEIVEALREDVEANTYQFVLTAIPDDATAITTQQALRVDELATERDRLKTEVTRLVGKLREANSVNQRLEDELRGATERGLAVHAQQTAAALGHDASISVTDLARRAVRKARAARDRYL
ncbi:MAG TPA: class I SAM-dependent methyltransferase [Jatrophihabitans sp.]|jgi:2-polyprenyl-3-methyl-5-hydroxy-6-metoxy-1,4-benzoquinol methylase